MPKAEYAAINLAIKERFFVALNSLMELGVLRGRQTYSRVAGIDKRNLYVQEQELSRSIMQLYWLVPLVTDYGINAKWLLTGIGDMWEIKPVKTCKPRRNVRIIKPKETCLIEQHEDK